MRNGRIGSDSEKKLWEGNPDTPPPPGRVPGTPNRPGHRTGWAGGEERRLRSGAAHPSRYCLPERPQPSLCSRRPPKPPGQPGWEAEPRCAATPSGHPPPQPGRQPPRRAGKAACPRQRRSPRASAGRTPPARPPPRPSPSPSPRREGPPAPTHGARQLRRPGPEVRHLPPALHDVPAAAAARRSRRPAATINPPPPARRLAPVTHSQGAGLQPPRPAHCPTLSRQRPGRPLARRPRGGSVIGPRRAGRPRPRRQPGCVRLPKEGAGGGGAPAFFTERSQNGWVPGKDSER